MLEKLLASKLVNTLKTGEEEREIRNVNVYISVCNS